MKITEHINYQIEARPDMCWNIKDIPRDILAEMRKSQDTRLWFTHEDQRVRAFNGYFTEFSLIVYPYMDFVDIKVCGLKDGIELDLINKIEPLQKPITPEILEYFHRQTKDWIDQT